MKLPTGCSWSKRPIFTYFTIILVPTLILQAETEDPLFNSPVPKSNSSISDSKYKFNVLKLCLILSGVNQSDIIPRDLESQYYQDLNHQWNTYRGVIYPMAYLVPRKVSDIQAAVNCCQQAKIRLVPKSGGHGYIHYAFGDTHSLVVDLRKLNEISVDKNTGLARIGAGNQVGRIQYLLWKRARRITPTGGCPSVGISGIALGGGWSFPTRLYGVASDNIVQLEMVDAAGKHLIINERSYSDLYWALRGGGGGNFGIVTSFTMKTYPISKYVIFATAFFRVDQFPDFFDAWQNAMSSINDRSVSAVPKIKGNIIRMFVAKYHSQDSSLGIQIVQNILDTFPTPINSTVRAYSYQEFLVVNANRLVGDGNEIIKKRSDLLSPPKSIPRWQKSKSFFVGTFLGKAQILQLYAFLQKFLTTNSLFIEHYGNQSAVRDFGPTDTAFVHRNVLFNVQLSHKRSASNNSNHAQEIENVEGIVLLEECFKDTQLIYNHNQSYQNYLDDMMPDYLERYYGENLGRLVKIKKHVDPKNFFHHPMSIPTKL